MITSDRVHENQKIKSESQRRMWMTLPVIVGIILPKY